MNTGLLARTIREKRGIVLLLAALAVANAALYGAVVYPLQQRVASADQRAAAAAIELASAQREFNAARDTVAGKERAEKALQRFYGEILPGDQSEARRITYLRLADLARQSNLVSDHRTFAVEADRNSSLQRLEMTMALSGDYADIRRFIHDLEQSKEFVVITGVELVKRQQNDALEVTLQLTTYYRTTGDGR
jgi:hypothetical protein